MLSKSNPMLTLESSSRKNHYRSGLKIPCTPLIIVSLPPQRPSEAALENFAMFSPLSTQDALYYGECRGDLPSRTGAQEGDDMVGLLAGCRCSGGSGENADVPCPVAEKQARFLEQPRECARCDRATRQAITRGEPARRPRLKPVLYIEIEDKASEKPVDAKAQGRYGPEGRHGGTNVDDNPQGVYWREVFAEELVHAGKLMQTMVGLDSGAESVALPMMFLPPKSSTHVPIGRGEDDADMQC